MKLNCDLGESYGQWSKGSDEEVMPMIDLANIACGFHAGDPETMAATIKFAVDAKVTIGAHPGYPDLVGFGRRTMSMSKAALISNIQYQIGALQGLCLSQNTLVKYVKPHGALYNDMMKELAVFESVCEAVASLDSSLTLMIQSLPDMSGYTEVANRYGITLWLEAFADRNYQDNGLLVDRSCENAVISDVTAVSERIKYYQESGQLLSVNGKALSLTVDTFCVHGDNPRAIELVRHIRATLSSNSQ